MEKEAAGGGRTEERERESEVACMHTERRWRERERERKHPHLHKELSQRLVSGRALVLDHESLAADVWRGVDLRGVDVDGAWDGDRPSRHISLRDQVEERHSARFSHLGPVHVRGGMRGQMQW